MIVVSLEPEMKESLIGVELKKLRVVTKLSWLPSNIK